MDGDTTVPVDLYESLMEAGKSAKARGQHRLSKERSPLGRSSVAKPRLVRSVELPGTLPSEFTRWAGSVEQLPV